MKVSGFIMAFALALAALPLSGATANAADSPAAPPDCTTANSTFTTMVAMPMPTTSSTDTLDKNFVVVMHMMSEHGMQMAKLEAACGKDAKTRDLASKMMREDKLTRTELMLLQSGH